MSEPEAAAQPAAPEHEDATAARARPDLPAEGPRRVLVPYLVVAALGLLAALIVIAQLWAYRDELRMILTQTPV